MYLTLKFKSAANLIESLDRLSQLVLEDKTSRRPLQPKLFEQALAGFKKGITAALQNRKLNDEACFAMMSAQKRAQAIFEGKQPEFEKASPFIRHSLQPKIDLKCRHILIDRANAGIAFPRARFTSADHAYFNLTGDYYYENQKTYPFLEPYRDFYPNPRTPECLAYTFFNQVREIYKNSSPALSFQPLRETLGDIGDICPKNTYPILYWAYKEALYAKADTRLLDFLSLEMIRAEEGDFRTEFQSSDLMQAIADRVEEAMAKLPVEWNLDKTKQPYWIIEGIFEALYEEKKNDWEYRLDRLKTCFPEFIEGFLKMVAELGFENEIRTGLDRKLDKSPRDRSDCASLSTRKKTWLAFLSSR